nr:phospholipase-like protein [Tanacetum cinerariifolium]
MLSFDSIERAFASLGHDLGYKNDDDDGHCDFAEENVSVTLKKETDRPVRYVKDPSTDTLFIFDIGKHTLEFGRWEFCLVTGFRFGNSCLDHLSKGRSGFHDRVFPEVARVKGIELNKVLHSHTDFNNLLDDDVVREVLNLVDDFSAWDNFPWGHHIWEEFHKRCDYDRLFHVRTRHIALTPSSDEMNKPWWKSSLEYFHDVSNASTSSHAYSKKKISRVKRTEVSREVHVRTEVSREVHVRTDVHYYADEGLSVQDLVKKIGDMLQEFQSRITAVEQYVNQHKTSSTSNDSPVDNVFSDTRDFDHDSFSRFTENPVDRAALMNKITDMRVDFQRRMIVSSCRCLTYNLPPGYVVDSDPEKDEKDPKEDPADYPADRGNNDDDESSNDDDDDDDVEKDDEDKEEEEQLASADPSDVSTDDLIPSS